MQYIILYLKLFNTVLIRIFPPPSVSTELFFSFRPNLRPVPVCRFNSFIYLRPLFRRTGITTD